MVASFLCGKICQTKEVKISAHACCHQNESQSTDNKNNDSTPCCQELQLTLSDGKLWQAPLAVVSSVLSQVPLHIFTEKSSFFFGEEARSSPHIPLYLSNQAFLI